MKKWVLILLAVCLVLVCGYAMYGTGEEPEQPGGYLLYFLEQDLESVPGGGALRVSGCRRRRRRIRRPWQRF